MMILARTVDVRDSRSGQVVGAESPQVMILARTVDVRDREDARSVATVVPVMILARTVDVRDGLNVEEGESLYKCDDTCPNG